MMQGVILYGPPASGKDTVTAALHSIDQRFVQFPRLKVGPGRTAGYRMTSADELAGLRETREIIWENSRYEAIYLVDRPGLLRYLAETVPVVHMGQPDGVRAVAQSAPQAKWLTVSLWCPRDVTEKRLRERGSHGTDLENRLRAWDETEALDYADLSFDTGIVDAAEAASSIHATAHLKCAPDRPE